MSKGKNSAGSSTCKSSTSSANTATVDSNVSVPDSDATASEMPQMLPLSTNPDNEDIDTDR